MYCYYVDGERMKEAKTKAVAEAKVEGLSFVSSNDVLTSGFASTCQPHQFTMAIQFRGRIDGLDGHDIGNYHNGVVFDRTTYSSAAGIRMALNGPKPYSRIQLPGCWRGSRCRLGMISNWVRVVSSFSCCPLYSPMDLLVRCMHWQTFVLLFRPSFACLCSCVGRRFLFLFLLVTGRWHGQEWDGHSRMQADPASAGG